MTGEMHFSSNEAISVTTAVVLAGVKSSRMAPKHSSSLTASR